MNKRPSPFTGADLVMGLAAVVGLVALFGLMRSEHPDAAAHYRLGEERALSIAAEFMESHGYTTEDFDASARVQREPALLDSLQRTQGRRATVQILRGNTLNILPAYHWRVHWRTGAASAGEEREQSGSMSVFLTLDGEVYAFEKSPQIRPLNAVDRQAFDAAFPGYQAVEVPDSLLERNRFELSGRRAAFSAEMSFARLERGEPLVVQGAAAEAMAEYHLGRSAIGRHMMVVDTVVTIPQLGQSAARVRFSGVEEVYGQRISADVDVTSGGALLGMRTGYNRPGSTRARPPQQSGDTFSMSGQGGIRGGVVFTLQVALVLMLAFAFFRRLRSRVVDAGTALRDAAVAGLFASLFVLATLGGELSGEVSAAMMLVILLVVMAFTGGTAALLIFVISSATNSMAHAVWPGKLQAMNLLRQGAVHNRPVGGALMRGVALGSILSGSAMMMLRLFGQVGIQFSGETGRTMLQEAGLSPAGAALAGQGWMSLFLVLSVCTGFGTWLYRWRRPWIVMLGIAAAFMALFIAPVTTHSWMHDAVMAGVIGALIGAWFWRYDLLSTLVGYFFFGVLWKSAALLSVAGAPAIFDGWILVGLSAAVVAVGFIGVSSGKTGQELRAYVPPYIEELAREERVTREFEIARQVHQSFLPRRMPSVEGIEVAAMCLAAQEVGGDYYDFVQLSPGRLAVVVGDVSGKGIQAAFYMTLTKGFLQTLCRETESPAELLRRLNRLFCENTRRGTFISMIYGIIDVKERTFTFARAGHNPLILKRFPSLSAEMLLPTGMAIGLVRDQRFDMAIEERTVPLHRGDVLVFYTDGFSEAMNAAREQYGEERLAARINRIGSKPADEILRSVSEDVHHFSEAIGRQDDMTMIVIRMTAAAPETVDIEESRHAAAVEEPVRG